MKEVIVYEGGNRIQLLNESFSVKTANSNICHAHVAWISLVSVFCGSGVVSGIRGKQMTPYYFQQKSRL